jgi:polyhydroxyalkanoate synthesis regulator phasin
VARLFITPKQWQDMDDEARARRVHKISKTVDDLTWRIEQLEKTVQALQRKLKT